MKRGRLLLVAVPLLCGCPPPAPVQKVVHPRPFPRTIALLPLGNDSTSMQAPILTRHLLEMDMRGGAYDTPEPAAIDATLKGLGITDGGQTGAVKPDTLGRALGVEGLLYGEITVFKYTNLGVLTKREVEVRLKLVEAATGETLWERTRRDAHSKAGLSAESIRENLVVGLGTKLVETALKSPLRPEAETVCSQLIRDLGAVRRGW